MQIVLCIRVIMINQLNWFLKWFWIEWDVIDIIRLKLKINETNEELSVSNWKIMNVFNIGCSELEVKINFESISINLIYNIRKYN